MLLADLGADVIKVEQPGTGDDTRAWGPPFAGDDATYFLSVNRNKRSLAARPARPGRAGRPSRSSCAAPTSSSRTSGPARWNVTGSAGSGCTSSTRGSSTARSPASARGKGAALPGYDLLVQAVGGLMSVTGEHPDRPVKAGVAVVDVLTGLHAAVGILAALRVRDATGRRAAGRGRPALHAAVEPGQPERGLHRGRVRARSARQPAPVDRAVRGVPHRGPPDGRRGRQRPPVRRAVHGPRHRRPIPRFATNTDRVAHVDELADLDRRAAWPTAPGPALVRRCSPRSGCRADRCNDIAAAFALADELGPRRAGQRRRAGRRGRSRRQPHRASPRPRPPTAAARPGSGSTPTSCSID